jgi:rhodanese-related sulfurtransferase
MLIDSRPYQTKYVNGSIPTAVSIPDSEFEAKKDLLPKDKKALLVFYCEGVECRLSHSSARKAEALGYKNVKVYPGGYPDWVAKGHVPAVGVEYVKDLLAKGETFLLVDSRPLAKYLEGSIPSALPIPDSAFEKKTGLLPADKTTPLIFFCGGYECPLSHKSAAKAKALGYAKVMVCEAGYPAWTKLYGGSAAAAIQPGGAEGAMSVEQFRKLLAEKPDSLTVIDVREPDEFAAGHVRTARNIPTAQLAKDLPGLSANKPVVFVCSTGARAGEAFFMAKDLRKDLKDVFYIDAVVKCAKDGTCEFTDTKK